MQRLGDMLERVGTQISLRAPEDLGVESATLPDSQPAIFPRGAGEGVDIRFVFKDWYHTPSNDFAIGMARRVVQDPRPSPLVIFYGKTGTGKSRLLHILGNELVRKGRRVLLVRGTTFQEEFLTAVHPREGAHNTMPTFQERYRQSWDDLLIDGLEDLETIGGRNPLKTQVELAQTVRAINPSMGERRVIFTSTKQVLGAGSPTTQFLSIPEALGSVLVGALQVPIHTPSSSELAGFAQWFARQRHRTSLPEAVAHFLAANAESNLRTIEGFVTKVVAYSKFSTAGGALSVLLAEEALGQDLGREARSALPRDIVEQVAFSYALSPGTSTTLRSNKRRLALHVACYLCRELVRVGGKPIPYALIGEIMRGKNDRVMHHSTVMHAVEHIQTILGCPEEKRSAEERLAVEVVAQVQRVLS